MSLILPVEMRNSNILFNQINLIINIYKNIRNVVVINNVNPLLNIIKQQHVKIYLISEHSFIVKRRIYLPQKEEHLKSFIISSRV